MTYKDLSRIRLGYTGFKLLEVEVPLIFLGAGVSRLAVRDFS